MIRMHLDNRGNYKAMGACSGNPHLPHKARQWKGRGASVGKDVMRSLNCVDVPPPFYVNSL